MKKILLVTLSLTSISMFAVWPWSSNQKVINNQSVKPDQRQTQYDYLTETQQYNLDRDYNTTKLVNNALLFNEPEANIIKNKKAHQQELRKKLELLGSDNLTEDDEDRISNQANFERAIIARHEEALQLLQNRQLSKDEEFDYIDHSEIK